MTEEMEKNFKGLEELYKLGMLDAEGYAFQKKQLEEEMARESGQAVSTPPPIQQETTSPSLEAPPPLPEMPRIHVSVGGKKMGEFEREEVIQKIRAGEIRRDARVWKKGMPDWVEAGSLPELGDYFGPPPDTAEEKKRVLAEKQAEEARLRQEREEAEARIRADAERRARIAMQEKAAAEARTQAAQAQTAREEAEAALERGKKHHENQDYNKAIKEFTEAIRLDPNYAYAYASRGWAYYEKGLYDSAISDCKMSLAIKPQDFGTMMSLNGLLQKLGLY